MVLQYVGRRRQVVVGVRRGGTLLAAALVLAGPRARRPSRGVRGDARLDRTVAARLFLSS